MDPIDRLARKLIDSFEHLEEHLLLEQLAVPEDLYDSDGDSDGSVELWVVSNKTYDSGEEIIVRGYISLPTSVAIESDAEELAQLFREELLASERFRHATTVAEVTGKATDEGSVPSAEEAQLN